MFKQMLDYFKYTPSDSIESTSTYGLVKDFNLVNAQHLVNYLQSKSLQHISVQYIEKYNKESLITIPNLEGRTLPKKYGANQCIYYLSDPTTPRVDISIGHSYIFSKTWHNLENYYANINPDILKIAYPQIDKYLWDSFVLARLITLYKEAAKGMYGQRTTIRWEFKENYTKGIVKPIEYILEDHFAKEEYLIWKPYITNEVFEELNKQPIIDW